jgi:RND family efflux transporter MFP subunit
VSVPTDSDFERTGFIDFVDNQVDAQTSTIEMWSDIDNDDVVLLPGQYVSIRVLLQTYEDTVVVPTTAILSTADSQYVWTMVDGKPTQAKLTLGPNHAGVTAVLSGLEAGATIVTQGGNRIRPGAAVQIVTPDAWDKANSNASAATTGAQGN